MTVRYIRLLKFDSTVTDDRNIKVVIVLTITNDLGDSSHPEPLDLSICLSLPEHDSRHAVRWTGTQAVQKYHFDLKAGSKKSTLIQNLGLSIRAEESNDGSVIADFLKTFLGAGTCIIGLRASKPVDESFSDRVITREFKLPGTHGTFNLFEEQGDSIYAHSLITCALLSRCQENRDGQTVLERALRETLSRGGNVIELGTGIGMVGKCTNLVFNNDKLHVTLTDLPSAGPLISRNISKTSPTSHKRQKVDRGRLSFEVLDWTLPIPEALSFEVDTILMTDVTYNETYHDALQDTLDRLHKAPDCRILFASKYRHVSERPFIASLKEKFHVLASSVYDGTTFESTSRSPTIGDVEIMLLLINLE